MNALADRVAAYTDASFPRPVIAMPFITTNEHITIVDNFTFRKTMLERRIDDEYNAGRLSANQVGQLKSQLSDVAALRSKYEKIGEISDSKMETLNSKLDRVETTMNKDIAYINDKRAHIGLKVN